MGVTGGSSIRGFRCGAAHTSRSVVLLCAQDPSNTGQAPYKLNANTLTTFCLDFDLEISESRQYLGEACGPCS